MEIPPPQLFPWSLSRDRNNLRRLLIRNQKLLKVGTHSNSLSKTQITLITALENAFLLFILSISPNQVAIFNSQHTNQNKVMTSLCSWVNVKHGFIMLFKFSLVVREGWRLCIPSPNREMNVNTHKLLLPLSYSVMHGKMLTCGVHSLVANEQWVLQICTAARLYSLAPEHLEITQGKCIV